MDNEMHKRFQMNSTSDATSFVIESAIASRLEYPTVVESLSDPDKLTRFAAIQCLLQVGGHFQEVLNTLLELVRDSDDFIRCVAVDYLCQIGPMQLEIADALVVAALADPNSKIRYNAAAALHQDGAIQ
jgi:HEAT repeat protein